MSPRTPLGSGSFRRAVDLVATDATTVVGALEDDFHHFRVTVGHDGERALRLVGEAVREPWTTCHGASDRLVRLEGLPLEPRSTAPGAHDEARLHCTHLFDLAGLALAHAWRQARGGAARRRYDATIPDPGADGTTTATLVRDGRAVLAWEMDGARIRGPAPFVDVPLTGGFLAWAEGTLDVDDAEAAIVLRRAVWISGGRAWDVPTGIRADQSGRPAGVCHTFQPEVITVARWTGRRRDFSTGPGPLSPAPG